ncbi:sulfatase-like hydrolase/transferase [Neorhodopirellula lusitana]|uniref:sulfatase-like hydrolase/transferase n=1 Tax=Neorhodopirellula lusitana TaxID=445327 RepID=UPI00384E6B09
MLNALRIGFAALALFLVTGSESVRSNEQPNIVLILADDVGIEGLECYGGTSYATPRLNELAAAGIRFTQAYSQPLCTPTRVELLTGMDNHRNWKSFGILDPNATTFAHKFKRIGYATAIFGKWQLRSYDPPDYPGAAERRDGGMHPKDAGFDEYALYHAGHTEAKGSRYANPTMLEGVAGDEGELRTYRGGYGEDVWVGKTIDFLDRHRAEPSMVYYPMALPHWPMVPTPNSDDWDPTVDPQPVSVDYAADMIEYMDTAVGNLVDGLTSKGLIENTLILFYSDNGTHVDVASQMADGRMIQGGKASPMQTGVHVPLIAYWPGKIAPGISDRIVDASDFFPTLLEIAGERGTDAASTDGISFARVLFPADDSLSDPRRESAFFWYDPRPGWDKERFDRHVFAINHHFKRFRDGRLFRLTDRPLEEILVSPENMTAEELAASTELAKVIENQMSGVEEPPLVNAFGDPL